MMMKMKMMKANICVKSINISELAIMRVSHTSSQTYIDET